MTFKHRPQVTGEQLQYLYDLLQADSMANSLISQSRMARTLILYFDSLLERIETGSITPTYKETKRVDVFDKLGFPSTERTHPLDLEIRKYLAEPALYSDSQLKALQDHYQQSHVMDRLNLTGEEQLIMFGMAPAPEPAPAPAPEPKENQNPLTSKYNPDSPDADKSVFDL